MFTMTTTTLSEDVVNIITKIADMERKKEHLENRIQHYESKIEMARETSLKLNTEEQDLAQQLQDNGYYYGQQNIESQYTPAESPIAGFTSDQLTSLLTSLLQQQQQTHAPLHTLHTHPQTPLPQSPQSHPYQHLPKSSPPPPQPHHAPITTPKHQSAMASPARTPLSSSQAIPVVPTSGTGSFGSVYNFPQHNTTLAPTSGPIRAIPKTSPTSAPGTILRHM